MYFLEKNYFDTIVAILFETHIFHYFYSEVAVDFHNT